MPELSHSNHLKDEARTKNMLIMQGGKSRGKEKRKERESKRKKEEKIK